MSPSRYVNIHHALCPHTSCKIRVYRKLSETFPTVSGVRQGCPISPFLFNFVIDVIMEECLAVSPGHSVQVLPGSKLLDLDYADDIVLLFDSVTAAQQTLDRLSEAVPS
ncbi:reverse transcriptase domain-containing protein, partial [Acinetobacter baumannii]|uniref:reverse transcriptase domain-containing protein n=1 Tax=Acinetobacter baumannii TaxID=470 RepID=UPI003392C894